MGHVFKKSGPTPAETLECENMQKTIFRFAEHEATVTGNDKAMKTENTTPTQWPTELLERH
jgi:hypothetical protein